MDQYRIVIIVGAIVIVLVIAGLVWLVARKRRSHRLRERFGPEYDRVLRKEKDVRRAEGILEWRTRRIAAIEIHPLSDSLRRQFIHRWRTAQSDFVDDPRRSILSADQLVQEVMKERGYPMEDFDQRAADISVDHPVVVENYRIAHDIALRHGPGQASTEDLRKAMVHYRSLFDELLGSTQLERKEADHERFTERTNG